MKPRMFALVGTFVPLLSNSGCAEDEPRCPDMSSDVTIHDLSDAQAASGIDTVCGNLLIEGPDITDLSPLSSVRYVAGSTIIQGTSKLMNLDGLGKIEEIGGHLVVENNTQLQAAVLPALTHVEGEIRVHENPALETVDIRHVSTIGGGIFFSHNATLQDLGRLDELSSIPHFVVVKNDSLAELELPEAEDIGALLVAENPALRSIEGGDNIRSIGTMLVSQNAALESIAVAARVESIDFLGLQGNDALTEIDTFDDLQRLMFLRVADNGGLESLPVLFPAIVEPLQTVFLINNNSLGDVSGLSGVGPTLGLTVINNDALDPEHVSTVFGQSAPYTKIDGNLGQPVPHQDECPWQGDVACDEEIDVNGFPGTGLCVDDPDCD